MQRVPQLLIGLVALAISLAVAGWSVGSGLHSLRRQRDTITVTGSAKQPISANLALWSLTVDTRNPDAAAGSRSLRTQAVKVRAFLAAQKVTADAISAPPQTIEALDEVTKDGRVTGRIATYHLSQSFTIRSTSIDTIDAAAGRIGQLVEQGVVVQAPPVQYLTTELAQARVEALKAATRDAKRRAETLVAALGGTLGSVRAARVGVYQVTPRNATDVSDSGINDTTSREKDVTAVVSVTFDVKQ